VSDDAKPAGGFSLRRWSARKRAAVGQVTAAQDATPIVTLTNDSAVPAPAPVAPDAGSSSAPTRTTDASVAASGVATPAAGTASANVALPPIESLTPDSDFTPFMRPDVEPSLRQAALRKLFADPHFNVMDGLDTYIDDYSKPDPISPDLVKLLKHARYVFAPPPTRVNAQGFVEDVPEEELAARAQAPATPPAIAPTEAAATPPQAIDAANAAALPAAPAEAIVSGAAAGPATDDAPRQIRLPLDVPPEDSP